MKGLVSLKLLRPWTKQMKELMWREPSSITVQKMALAMSQQRSILKIQKPVEVLN